ALSFKATMSDHEGNTTTRVPVTVTYKMLEGAEREKVLHPPPPPKVEPKPLTDAELAKALEDLKGSDAGRRKAAADKLALAVAGKGREEVARALAPLLKEEDAWTRLAAVKALGVWGTKESVPALLRMLDDKAFFVPGPAIESLGQLKDPRVAEPI